MSAVREHRHFDPETEIPANYEHKHVPLDQWPDVSGGKKIKAPKEPLLEARLQYIHEIICAPAEQVARDIRKMFVDLMDATEGTTLSDRMMDAIRAFDLAGE